ncbi:MAG TPA: DUF6159 family protein [Acidimicrobiales bacterium]|nr:DUF6159 family protein [Acidimicrobiales bacterium]
MSRVRRGFKLAGVSWRVIVAEPAILVVLAVGLVGMVVVSGGLFLLLFRRFPTADDFEFPKYLVALPVLWLGTVVTTYCNVVVSVMADRRLRGEDPTVADGMTVATAKLNRIVSWTMITIAIGLLLQVIAERFRLAGVLVARLLGLGWNLATMFVIPVIALEDRSVRDSISRSASIFKSKWGESVVAQGTVGLAVMFAAIPAIFVVILCAAISAPLGIAAAVVVFGGLMLISGALDAVVDVALYRYAMDGTVLGAFTAEDLDDIFRPKHLDD